MKYKNIDKIVRDSIAFLKDDYTELWIISTRIIEENPDLNLIELREAINIVLSQIENSNNIKIVDTETEKSIQLQKGEIMEIVNEHLLKLNKKPNIGDGIWLTI